MDITCEWFPGGKGERALPAGEVLLPQVDGVHVVLEVEALGRLVGTLLALVHLGGLRPASGMPGRRFNGLFWPEK